MTTRPHSSAPDAPSLRLSGAGYVAFALLTMAMSAVVFFVLALLQGRTPEDDVLRMVLIPLFVGAVVALRGLQAHLTWRRSRRAARVGMALASIALFFCLLGVVGLEGDAPLGTAPVWCWWVEAAVFAASALVVGRLAPGRGVRRVPAPRSDEEWFDRLGAELRLRRGYGDADARRIVGEARSAVAASGRSAQEELGTPAAYALTFPARARARRRRALTVWLGCCAAVSVLVAVVSSMTAGRIDWAWTAIAAGAALLAWWFGTRSGRAR